MVFLPSFPSPEFWLFVAALRVVEQDLPTLLATDVIVRRNYPAAVAGKYRWPDHHFCHLAAATIMLLSVQVDY